MTTHHEDDLALALELADIADGITMARYRAADLAVETKPDMTPVSESDKAAELALRERLAQARPGDPIIGEEFGGAEFDAADPSSGRAWVIDPIDGTKSYVRGMDTWTTLIALLEDGEVKVGVVAMPALAKRWWAVRGHGAFADGRRIQVSRVAELGTAQFLWSGIEEWDAIGGFQRVVDLGRRCWRTRGVGDAWQYMLVAEGAAEIATDPEATLWDLAAVSIVVEEAGGRFTSLAGIAGAGAGSGLATNGRLHEVALAALGTQG
ncbi:MAG TPA: inositol monophosphatase family protein [Solirubrobacteraceae bacterium]|nr:inositol monophosphatase family protein [Solirubrobacteraceae bacterium]